MRREFLIATFLIATLNAQKPVVPGGTGEIAAPLGFLGSGRG